MFREMLKYLKVSLKMFGEDDSASSTSMDSDPSSVLVQQATERQSSRANVNNPLANVVYGKQEVATEPIANAQAEIVEEKLYSKKELGEHIQSAIKDRFKNHSVVEQRVAQLDPVISALMEKYGATSEQHLLELVQNDTIEDYAEREGISVEQAKLTYNLKAENKALQDKVESFASEEKQAVINQQVAAWRAEEAKIKESAPTFSLDTMSENEQFMKLLKAGIEMKVIYQVMNLDSILAETAKQATKNTAENIKARGNKIAEAGAKPSSGAGIIVKTDVNSHTREDTREINRRVARGERITL